MATRGLLIVMFVNFVCSQHSCKWKLHSNEMLPRSCIVKGVWADYDYAHIHCSRTRLYVNVDGEDVTVLGDFCGRCFMKSSTIQELLLLVKQKCINNFKYNHEKIDNILEADTGQYESESWLKKTTSEIVTRTNGFGTTGNYINIRMPTPQKYKFRKSADAYSNTNTNSNTNSNTNVRDSLDNESVPGSSRSKTEENVNNTHDNIDYDLHPNESIHEGDKHDNASSSIASKLPTLSTNMLISLGLFQTLHMLIS